MLKNSFPWYITKSCPRFKNNNNINKLKCIKQCLNFRYIRSKKEVLKKVKMRARKIK